MRIISGRYKRKQIHPPKNFHARPTTDMAKESLFNIIENQFDITQLYVLDLFSGAGGICFEFASRDSKLVHAVELNYHHYSFILSIKKELQFNQLKVIKADAFRYLKNCAFTYDLVFADPPYDHPNINSLPDLVFEKRILKPGGWFILEHSEKFSFENHSNFLELRNYSRVHFSIFASK